MIQKALCVGAGPEQTPSIIEAQRLGLQVVAVDVNPAAPGLSLAEYGLAIDIADEEAVISAARQHNVSLVLPAPLGRYLTTVGAVNDALGLRGISRQAAVNCTDKAVFHALCVAGGLDRPRQSVVRPGDSLQENIKQFPCILKPRHGSGKKGVVVVQDSLYLQQAVEEHRNSSGASSDTLVEELIDGLEVGVDGIVVDGRAALIMVREKKLTPLPYRQEIEYLAPAPLSEATCSNIHKAITRCVNVLGLDNCLLNADVIIRKDGSPVIIEIAGRPGGLLITHKIIPAASGVNVLSECIKMLWGQSFSFEAKESRNIALCFLHLPPGRVRAVPNPDQVQRCEGVIEFASNIKPGDRLEMITCSRDVLARGYVMTSGATAAEALQRARQIMDLFDVEAGEE